MPRVGITDALVHVGGIAGQSESSGKRQKGWPSGGRASPSRRPAVGDQPPQRLGDGPRNTGCEATQIPDPELGGAANPAHNRNLQRWTDHSGTGEVARPPDKSRCHVITGQMARSKRHETSER